MSAPMQIVILEDNAERRRLMRDAVVDRFPQYDLRFFITAGEAIAQLRENYGNLLAIILDHDLDLIPVDGHRLIDPGSGRDVADFLATQPVVCPIVIHTTNGPAAVGMETVLHDAGWKTYRVIPVGEFKWIPKLWFQTVRNAIVESVNQFEPLSNVSSGTA
jgi:hypothetical protein